MPANPRQVQQFLSDFKKAAERELSVIPRKINLDFLTSHGMTPGERKELILGLKVGDYWKGPEDDNQDPGQKDVWFFGIEYVGLQIYIKLRLIKDTDTAGETTYYAKCLSFHEAQWRIRYPFKGRSL